MDIDNAQNIFMRIVATVFMVAVIAYIFTETPAIAIPMGLCLLLQFRFPKIGGVGMIVLGVIYIVIICMTDLLFIEDLLPPMLILIYLSMFVILVHGKFTKIVGRGKMSDQELVQALANGFCLVRYEYVFSVVFMTYRLQSPIHLVSIKRDKYVGMLYSLISLVFGPWGFPWGIIWTFGAIKNNFEGGEQIA